MDFIHKVPLAPSKWLSRWIKMDKLDYFHFCLQDFFFYFLFSFLFNFSNMKQLSKAVLRFLVFLSFVLGSKTQNVEEVSLDLIWWSDGKRSMTAPQRLK